MAMPAHPIFLLFAVVVSAIAAWTDWRTGKIPNRLTLGVLVRAPIAHFAAAILLGRPERAIEAAGMSVVGAAACGVVPLFMYRAGGICGGDVKLLDALGAICLPTLGIELQVFAFLGATFYAMGALAYQGKLFST